MNRDKITRCDTSPGESIYYVITMSQIRNKDAVVAPHHVGLMNARGP